MKRIMLLVAASGIAGCVTGIQPPDETPMAPIKGGEFVFGTELACRDGAPLPCPQPGATVTSVPVFNPTVKVALKPFLIDVHEVTNFQYRHCVEVGDCPDPAGYNVPNLDDDYFHKDPYKQHPVIFVTAAMAEAYCASVGRRLPTELEWERVAKGPALERRFPLDAGTIDTTRCTLDVNTRYCKGQSLPARVGASTDDWVSDPVADRLPGAPDWKVWDLAGNVSEWVKDPYDPDMTCQSMFTNPTCNCLNCSDAQCVKDCYTKCTECDLNDLCFAWCPSSFEPTKGLPRCIGYDPNLAQDPATILPKSGGQRLARGGDYYFVDKPANLCRGWSTDRTNKQDLAYSHNTIGFRCAADLPADCLDGKDNDEDGQTDLADSDCLTGATEAAGG